MPQQNAMPRFRPVIRVFVSSTFSDMKQERNALQEQVFPKLEQLCAQNGFQFQAIDLRWGVSSQAGLNHRTMRICFDELRRAQEVSPRPNFLILLGNRYGWRPLPEEISVAEFQALEREAVQVATATGQRAAAVLQAWYRRDENAVPPVYLLQSRRQQLPDAKDYSQDAPWNEAQAILWEIIECAQPPEQLRGRFDAAALAEGSPPAIVRFQTSATEQEIWHGALRVSDAREHVLAFFRQIENVGEFSEPKQIESFVDIKRSENIQQIDKALWKEQERLKEALKPRLGGKNIFVGSARLVPARDAQGRSTADVTTDHLAQLCADVEGRLKEIIQAQIEEYWNKSAQGSVERAARELKIEQDEHERFGRERGGKDTFVGRINVLQAIRDYLQNDSPWSLVVHGSSGCGKTALLARAAEEIPKRRKPIIRFIGTTPQSSDIRSLLRSLCQQLRGLHQREGELPTNIKTLSEELQKHFQSATPEQPLILFLDALDQLSDADGGRLLNWIPTGQLPPHVKMVVSCLSDRAKDDPAGQPFAEFTRRQLIAKNSINLDALSEAEASTLLFKNWLHLTGRKVSDQQRERIEQILKTKECRQPIYLKLLFEEARLWHSYDAAPELGESVSAILGQLFERLSQPANHGSLLVERVLGYLAASRHGLAENEILEVLFTDSDYKATLHQATEQTRHELPASATRIPIAIWSRLRFDLAPYLTERAAPSATVLTFYHRQVEEWVRAIALNSVRINWRPHERLADFFERKADPTQDSTWKTASSRALEELPYHLAQDANVPRWERTVSDLLFVEVSCRAGLVFELLRDLDDGLCRLRSTPVQIMRQAVASSLRTITKHPEFCLSILCNRLLWAEPNGLIAEAAARAAAALDASGVWLQAASPIHTSESIPLNGRYHHQAFITAQQAFAVADGNGNLEIRSIWRGELLAKRTVPSKTLTALAVEPAQSLAAWLDRNGDIRAEISQNVLPGRNHETVVAYPRDDSVIAVDGGGNLVAWNPLTGDVIMLEPKIPYPLVTLRANCTASRILFVAGDRASAQTAGVVSISDGRWTVDKLRWVGKPIMNACLNSDGTRALIVDAGRGLNIVEISTGNVVASTAYERRGDVAIWGSITACAFGNGKEGETAVVTTDKGQVWAWTWKHDRFTACGDFKGLQEGDAVHLLEIMPDGRAVFLSTSNRAVFFCMDGGRSAMPHSAAVTNCAVTESELVGSICREERTLKWWKFQSLEPIQSFLVEPPRVVVADENNNCVFLGTDNGLLYRFPKERAPQSKDIFRLFDHPVASVASERPGVAIAASTQGLIARVNFVTDQVEWLYSHTTGQRHRSLFAHSRAEYLAVREVDAGNRGAVVVLGTGQNMEQEIYRSDHSSVLVAASIDGGHLVIHDRSTKVFKLEEATLTLVFTVDADPSISAIHLLFGDKYLLLSKRDEPWLQLRRLVPGVPIVAVLELPSAPSCVCARNDKIAIGFQSGDLLCVKVRDVSQDVFKFKS